MTGWKTQSHQGKIDMPTLNTPPGVSVRGNSIHISFSCQGKRLNPVLKGLKANKTNIAYAYKKKTTIEYEIEKGVFEWENHFTQKCPAAIAVAPSIAQKMTVSEVLDDVLANYERTVSKGTLDGYRSKSNKIRSRFGKYKISDLVPSEVESWVYSDLMHLSNKTINEVFIVFRGILKKVRKDMIARQLSCAQVDAVMEELHNRETDTELEPDPFTSEEMGRIANLSTTWVQEVNLFLFGCESGLSKSELFGLGWQDIDLEANQAKISRAIVSGKFKVPKTKKRRRIIDLTEQAVAVLKKQMAHTYLRPAITVEVVQRDNRSSTKELHRPVFMNSKTQKIHAGYNAFNDDIFHDMCRQARVRYRGINFVRHTFISRMLTIDMPLQWLISQVGHTSEKMIRKHYGKYMRDERPNMSCMASQRLKMLSGDSLPEEKTQISK